MIQFTFSYVVRKPSWRTSDSYTYTIRYSDKDNRHHTLSMEVKCNDSHSQKIIEDICCNNSVALLYSKSDNQFFKELSRVKLRARKSTISLYEDDFSHIKKRFL